MSINAKLGDDFLDFRSIGITTNLKITSTTDKLTLSGQGTVSITSVSGLDITANTLKITTITSTNLNVSGLTIAPSISTININTTNISVTGLLLATAISTGTLSVSGASNLQSVTATNINSTSITTSVLKSTVITNTNLYVSDSEYVSRMYGSSTISNNIGSFNQFQPKMVATGSTGAARQGASVAISSIDGSYIAVAGPVDGSNVGANWIFIRSGSTYVQQSVKLVGTGYNNAAEQGSSVCIDPSGLTMVTGGIKNNRDGAVTAEGALWCFQRIPYTQTQLGPKLVGSSATGPAQQGYSVSLSSYDSSYLASGGSTDNTNVGAVWMYIRSGPTYIQQQAKLVGTGLSGQSGQGRSVSLDSLGLTLVSGGPGDFGGTGATWLFERSGSTWSQIGTKLIGTGSTASAEQGQSVSLSSDGLTLAIGGPGDNTSVGALWVFTRASRGITFTQLQPKLIGSETSGYTRQGYSVSISPDNSYIAVGGPGDASNTGTTWVYIKGSGGTYSQFCPKISATISVSNPSSQGASVSISSSGQYLAVGGPGNGGNVGATWIFIRSGSGYYESQYLLGTGAAGNSYQGASVSLNPDASLLTVGGYLDNTNTGATWLFVRSGTTFYQSGLKLVGSGSATSTRQGYSISLTNDYLAVGGYTDSTNVGATWTYSISDVWTQQFTMITASNLTTNNSNLGTSTSISGDSLTIIAGAPGTVVSTNGEAVIFTRVNMYSRFIQLQKLVSFSASGVPDFGTSVSISKDANYIAVGGPRDNGYNGATWIFKKSGATYVNDTKLIGTNNTGTARQGQSVAINADGTYLAVGGNQDNSFTGAVWVFNRIGPTWSQVQKLVGTGNSGQSYMGISVSINSDGTIITAGGYADNTNKGAAWVFVRSGTTFYQSTTKIIGTGLSGSSLFGHSVSLADNGYLAIGARADNTDVGATYTFSNAIGMNVNNSIVRFTGRPAFRATDCQNAFNIVSGGTSVNLVFTTVIYNVTNSYNSSNGVFTAPVSGVYLFDFGMLFTEGPPTDLQIQVDIKFVTSVVIVNRFQITNQYQNGLYCTSMVYLQAGYTTYINFGAGGNNAPNANATSNQCWFSGTLIS